MGYDGEDITGTPRWWEDFGPGCECQECDTCLTANEEDTMGFCTRNSDGASGLGEPTNTVPARDQRGMEKVARNHSCGSTGELYTAGPKGPNDFDPKHAGRN